MKCPNDNIQMYQIKLKQADLEMQKDQMPKNCCRLRQPIPHFSVLGNTPHPVNPGVLSQSFAFVRIPGAQFLETVIDQELLRPLAATDTIKAIWRNRGRRSKTCFFS